MKAKRGAEKRGITFWGPVAVVAVAIGVLLCSFVSLSDLIKYSGGYPWDKASVEKSLGIPLPADANDIKFDSHRGRGGKLAITFEASYESVDAFVSHFCGGKLYQGYDPFNAIDTKERHEGAHLITIEEFYLTINYYSYSPNTSDKLFGIRCLSDGLKQIHILVDKTSLDVALLKMEALFTCRNCMIPEPTSVVPSQKSE